MVKVTSKERPSGALEWGEDHDLGVQGNQDHSPLSMAHWLAMLSLLTNL